MTDQYLLPTYGRQPVTFVRGDGCWLYDDTGKGYLDALAGIGVNCLGHSHPAVVNAISHQSQKLIHVSNNYQIPNQEALAGKLCQLTGMEKIFFGNSGAEANEAAIKLARFYGHKKRIEKPVVLVMEGAFHGRTLATLSATANPTVQAGFEPLVSGFVRVPFNNVPAVEKAIADNPSIVAILVEPIQGEGGVNIPDNGYLTSLRRVCDQHELLLMLDEVQTGNGRTGHYFAYQEEGILPDVVSTAKGLGGGLPIGACLTRGPAAKLLGPGNHGSTFGGNPLCAAVALAVVETLQSLIPGVTERANQLCNQLQESLKDFPIVQDIQHKGFMIGIRLDGDATPLVDLAREQGLLINVTAGSVVRLLPPLTLDARDIDTLCQRLAAAFTIFANSRENS